MATTSIGDGAGGFVAAELIQTITRDLANELGATLRTGAKTGAVDSSKPAAAVPQPAASPAVPPVTDVSKTLLSEVATADLAKLTKILEPAPNQEENKILDTLLKSAIQEVAAGNAQRAIGYLADYATRDPKRAEMLPDVPALEPVRDKIDAMMNRMTVVAKMSAEDGLSRAEHVADQPAGKLPQWETHAEVLLQLAHRLFESGGYANYARTSELARLVSEAAETRPAQALAASAAAASTPINVVANQMTPGVNVPYWVSPDVPVVRPLDGPLKTARSRSHGAIDDMRRNWRDLKDISTAAIRQLWHRAPLLVMMLTWFAVGLAGGLGFAIASRIWPQSLIVAIGNFSFDLWGIGFLALVGFGFYARVRRRT